MILLRTLLLALIALASAAGIAAAQNLKVEVAIEGVPADVAARIRPFSSVARNPRGYSALAPVRRAIAADADVMAGALAAEGYFAAKVRADVIRRDGAAAVTFSVEPGPLFTLRASQIVYVDTLAGDIDRPATLADFGVAPVTKPSGAAIAAAERALQLALWERGFIGSEMLGHEVRANFAEGEADLVFTVKSGPVGTFGPVVVDGADRTDDAFVRQLRTFETGELAQRPLLDEYRDALVGTGLFSEVDIQARLPEPDGSTPIGVRVTERPHRTLGGGVSYATDIGPGADVFWENRNFFKRGETLRAAITASAPIQQASLSFRKPRPRLPGFYNLGVLLRNEDTDAFNAQTTEIGGSLGKFWLDQRLTTEGGLRYQYSKITSRDSVSTAGDIVQRDRIFQAVSIPLSIQWNSQDAPLDPQTGFLAGVRVTPFFGTVDFNRVEFHHTNRIFWGRNNGGTLAGRMKIGATYGASRNDLPPTERYFAGGGGSLRGYAFQEASPIDPVIGDILGGASLAELNIEARQHVTEAIELAIFADAGGAYENNTPDFENVLVAAGFGVRYVTPIGPLRADVAFPLDRREIFGPDTDEDGRPIRVFQDTAWQFYIGLGQPF
ncbi:MAG: BamA/TamA family outer membrane protein [Pseudomonadota bacterium]